MVFNKSPASRPTLILAWWFILAALSFIIVIGLSRALRPIGQILAAPLAAFFYPLELEWREGSFWLDAMALHDKIPIYDHSVVAYLSMAHGPMDSLLKSWIMGWFPFLAPWQVTRVFVLLLPIAFVACSGIILHRRVKFCWLWGALLGLTFYIVLLALPAGYFLLFGRTDATAYVLAIMAIAIFHHAVHTTRGFVRNLFAFGGGVLLAAAYLTIWRLVPALGAIALVMIVAIGIRTSSWRIALAALAACATGGMAVFVAVLFGAMSGNLTLFWEHFYKIFLVSYNDATNPGFLGLPQEVWDDFGPGLVTIVADRDGFFRACAVILLCPVLLIVASRRALREDFSYLRAATYQFAFVGLYGLTLATLLFGYLLHFRAGSLVYFSFIYVLGWYSVCLSLIASRDASSISGGASIFVTCGILLLICVGGVAGTSAGDTGAMFMRQMDAARAFDYELSQLREKYTVVSDAYHFFKRRFDNDLLDQGDFPWQFAEHGYFDEEFTHTVEQYVATLQQSPPDIIVLGVVSAPPIRELVKHGYRCIVCGVQFFAYGAQGFSLYAREDLPIDELRARFATFGVSPQPVDGK